jgi:hypothetical protein
MKLTITTILCGAFVALGLAASAQTSYTLSGTCKPFYHSSVPAGDPGRTFTLERGKCSDKETVGGATATGGQYAERGETTASRSEAAGIYTVTFNTGDKIYYQYDISFVQKGGVVQSGSGTFAAVGGTGKMKGITAKGTCTVSAGPTKGTNNYNCTGQYQLAGAM